MSQERKPRLIEYVDLVLWFVFRRLPVTWTSSIGGTLGGLYGRWQVFRNPRWLQRMHATLERFGPVPDPAERKRRLIRFFRGVGRVYAEFCVLQRLIKEGRIEVVGRERLRDLSRPAIIASCHLANWELVGYVMTQLEGLCCVVYAPPDNPIKHRLAVHARLAWQDLVDKSRIANQQGVILMPSSTNPMRQTAQALIQGRNLLMYVDEERGGYVWSPSLGRTIPYAGNRWLTARLAVRHQADIVPVYVEATGRARYRIVIEPRLTATEGDAETRARSLAEQLDERLNAWIRPRLEQWYWLPWFDFDKSPPARTPTENLK